MNIYYVYQSNTGKSAKCKSSAGTQHETQLSDCQISSISTRAEEDHKSAIETPPHQKLQKIQELACKYKRSLIIV
jgi:hypothetical protein